MREYNTKKSNSWDKVNVKPKDIPKETFIEVCNNSESMAHACSKLGLHFTTFKKYALIYDCYKTNQSGKNINKQFIDREYKLEDIINKNLYPQYQPSRLKNRLINEGIKKHECEKCKNSTWNDVLIPLELNHIDGNRYNNLIDNLELLCPNCHAQTSTYRGKNKKHF